jgi:flagellar biosynthetic protein FliP
MREKRGAQKENEDTRKNRKKRRVKKFLLIAAVVLLVFVLPGCSAVKSLAGNPVASASASAGAADTASSGATDADQGTLSSLLGGRSETVDLLILLTILSILPSILIMMTCFPRIIIVLSLIRNGLGLTNMPPNQVLIGLALFLTFFIMSPVINEVNTTAYQPYVAGQVTEDEALDLAMKPVRGFMMKQTFQKDLDYFVSVSGHADEIKSPDDVPNTTLIPAFMTSELKRGFEIGFFLYIPFVVIDMVVATVLMSMGMMMLPPAIISLPFKLLLFVLVDGWTLTVQTLINSFG